MKKIILSLAVGVLLTSSLAFAENLPAKDSGVMIPVADFSSMESANSGKVGKNPHLTLRSEMNHRKLTAAVGKMPVTCTVDYNAKSTGLCVKYKSAVTKNKHRHKHKKHNS